MALYLKEEINDGTLLAVWKKEEELDFLLRKVSIKTHEIDAFERMTAPRRKKEWLTTRLLLANMMGEKKSIHYAETGKPKINNSPYRISISHSKDFVAILISASFEPGIDVEHIAERVLKVRHKFLNETEQVWCQKLELNTICWSAKEAIFKTIGENVDFKDIHIAEFSLKENTFQARLEKYERNFVVNFRIFENNVLTFTLPNIICNIHC